MIHRLKNPENEVRIAVVGKYISLPDAYKSIYEALIHGGIANNAKVVINKVDSENLDDEKKVIKHLGEVQGILVPGGFGTRGVEGKIRAVQYARENKIPFLGICLGMQIATIEFARHVCGMKNANSTEFAPDTEYPVISLLEEQRNISNMGGSMRLGSYACKIEKNSQSVKAYRKENISERHRHRYEFNNKYLKVMESKGMVFAGKNSEQGLVEIIEIKDHPWFVACQFHPEFKSKPEKAHPLFREFISSALQITRKDAKDNAKKRENLVGTGPKNL